MAYFLSTSMTLCSSLFLIFTATASLVAAQSSNGTSGTDFTWSPDVPTSCDTYVAYRARSPYSNIGSISDLFGVSRLEIANATGLASEDALLARDQVLTVPIKCTSNGTHFFSNITYEIKKGENFYAVSTIHFENLTNFYVVEDMNPALNPINLTVGVQIVFPLFCKCPKKSYTERGVPYLITYVWQPGDDVISVTDMFRTSASDIMMENNNRNFTAAVFLPVLIPAKSPIIWQKFHPVVKAKHHRIFVAILGGVMAFLIACSSLAVFFHFLHKKNKKLAYGKSFPEFADLTPEWKVSKDETFEPKTPQDKLLPGVSGYLGKPIMYDAQVIVNATMNLSEQSKLGGLMYRAVIDGNIFAVKETKDATEELQILQRVNHVNLVKLMGISSYINEHFFIVYEYIEKGSLENWLFTKKSSSPDKVEPLSWKQRLCIALDVANGLQYLHEHTQPSIAHKDISTKNILLDSDFRAKISNFATAQSVAPFSTTLQDADVFAFGVVLLELLSGKRATQTKDNGEVVMLWKEIKEVLDSEDQRNDRLRQWMDPNLKDGYPLDDALTLAMLARTCTVDNLFERPKMSEIVFNLCILMQSSHLMYDTSWISSFEAGEVFHPISPGSSR